MFPDRTVALDVLACENFLTIESAPSHERLRGGALARRAPRARYASAMATSSGRWSDAVRTASGVLRTSQRVKRGAYAVGMNT